MKISRRKKGGWTSWVVNFSKTHCDGCGERLWVNPGGNKYCEGRGSACDGKLDAVVQKVWKFDDLDAMCAEIQEVLGVKTGDTAAMFWDSENEARFHRGKKDRRVGLIREYIQAEHEEKEAV